MILCADPAAQRERETLMFEARRSFAMSSSISVCISYILYLSIYVVCMCDALSVSRLFYLFNLFPFILLMAAAAEVVVRVVTYVQVHAAGKNKMR